MNPGDKPAAPRQRQAGLLRVRTAAVWAELGRSGRIRGLFDSRSPLRGEKGGPRLGTCAESKAGRCCTASEVARANVGWDSRWAADLGCSGRI